MESGVVHSDDVELCCYLEWSQKIQSLYSIILWQRAVLHSTPNFAQKLTPIHLDGGEYIKNKSFLQYVARAPTAKTQIFQGKKQQLGFDRFTMTPDSCGGSGLDLKGLKGPRTERAEKDGTSGHPWGEVYRLEMITSLPLSESIATPFVERHNFDGEECKVGRDMSGWDGRERRGVKKKRFHCVSQMVFSKSKWATDETTEGRSETVFEESIKWRK